MTKTIRFKSNPENWRKEFLGLKCNTLRHFDDHDRNDDVRLEILRRFIAGTWTDIYIEIENTDTFEVFRRRVSDVTWCRHLYIISWRGEL